MVFRFTMIFGLCLALSNCAAGHSQKADEARPQAKSTFFVETSTSSALLQIDLQNKKMILQKTEDGACQQWKTPLPQEINRREPFAVSGALTLKRDRVSLVIVPYDYQNSMGVPCSDLPMGLLKIHVLLSGNPVVRHVPSVSEYFNFPSITNNSWEYPSDAIDLLSSGLQVSPVFDVRSFRVIGISMATPTLDSYLNEVPDFEEHPELTQQFSDVTVDATKLANRHVHLAPDVSREEAYHVMTGTDYRTDNVKSVTERKATLIKFLNYYKLSTDGVDQ